MPAAAAFRLTPELAAESDIHEACAKALNYLLVSPPAEWCCYPAGLVELDGQQIARFIRAGLKAGYPDLFIFHEGIWGIELKRHGARLSKTRIGRTRRGSPRVLIGQEEMFPRLLVAGFRGIAIAHTVDEMLAALEGWGVPLRKHYR